jgi:hypothetical protein
MASAAARKKAAKKKGGRGRVKAKAAKKGSRKMARGAKSGH